MQIHYEFISRHDGTVMRVPMDDESAEIIDNNPGGNYGIFNNTGSRVAVAMIFAEPPAGTTITASHWALDGVDSDGLPVCRQIIDATEPVVPPPVDSVEAARQESLADAQAQYAAYCIALGFPGPVDMDELTAAMETIGASDTVMATRIGLTFAGLVARMQRLARDPAALDQILETPEL